MKSFGKIISVIILLAVVFTLSSCSSLDKDWEGATFTWFGEDIITWNSDSGVDKYQVYIDGELFKETADEYCLLEAAAGNHKLKVVKVKDGKNYVSEEIPYNKIAHSQKYIASSNELKSNYQVNGRYPLGSIKYDEVILSLGGSSDLESKPIVAASSLNIIRIICDGGTVNNFSLKIEERTSPLTVIFENANITSSVANAVYTDSSVSFEATVIALGNCSFTNGYNGGNGADGAWGGGVQAGNGGGGGNGGSIFALPSVKFFSEKQPSFTTGNGGNGGDGGSATNAFTHGGYAGNGGSGGYAFKTSSLVCFNGRYTEYGGSFGKGGSGGKGGYGNFSGNRPNGANGAAGAFSNVAPTYLSRTNGVIPEIGGSANGSDKGFPISYVNGYIVWTEQPDAMGYEIIVDGNTVNTVTQNVYYAGGITNITSSEVKVKTLYSDSSAHVYEYSSRLEIYESNPTELTAVSGSISGGKHIAINAENLAGVSSLNVSSEVKRLSIIGNGHELNLSINAAGRTDNLIIDLHTVTVYAPVGKNAISLNDGIGTSDGSCPMLLLNLYDATVVGGRGTNGSKGKDADGFFAFGANGEDGGRGGDGIKAYYAAVMGESGVIAGGMGGKGGAGGDASTNNGGDGGTGGRGGDGANVTCLYVIMDEESSTVSVESGRGGSGGNRGDGFGDALDSSRPGNSGSSGSKISGSYRTYIGNISGLN